MALDTGTMLSERGSATIRVGAAFELQCQDLYLTTRPVQLGDHRAAACTAYFAHARGHRARLRFYFIQVKRVNPTPRASHLTHHDNAFHGLFCVPGVPLGRTTHRCGC